MTGVCGQSWRIAETPTRYRKKGDLEIENNSAELSLRGVAVGRKNCLFFGSDRGGRTAAILTSFIVTCNGLQISPFTYLPDAFGRISAVPMNRLHDLLRDNWKAAQPATKNLPA